MIALTRSQDNVEAINKALRNAGHPVHVTWLPDARDLGDALTQASAEMLMLFADEGIVDLASAMDFRARFAPDVPVLIVREKLDEVVIAEALALGAQDAVTLANVPRLQLVVGRELRTYRLDRALSSTLASAREAKKQLQHIVEGSTDAIAQVQEGIIVDANPGLARALRLLESRGSRRHAADGRLRSRRPRRDQGRARRLHAGQVVRPHAARLGPRRERPHAVARVPAGPRRVRRRALCPGLRAGKDRGRR